MKPTQFEFFQMYIKFCTNMIDGKVVSVIAESTSQKCGICGATPTMMNYLNAVKNRSYNINMFKYGMSTLHVWIRCFECILYIAYRIPTA